MSTFSTSTFARQARAGHSLFDAAAGLHLMKLRPPLEPALVRPPARRLKFGSSPDIAFEPKWDGLRALCFRGDSGVDLQTRRGRMITDFFPDVAAALELQVAPGTVLDGELVVWDGTRLHYAALQARLTAPVWPRVPDRREPVGFVLFDLLAEDGQDLLARPYIERRARLEQLAERVGPPLFLTDSTTDPALARSWYDTYPAAGIEGLILKPVAAAYRPGQQCWDQVRHRRRVRGVVAGVLGTPSRPTAVVVGRPDRAGRLRLAGATRPLLAEPQRELGELLQPAGADHPWPGDALPGALVGRPSNTERVSYLRVEPTVVVDVAVDAAWNPHRWRHLGDLVALRRDLAVDDLAPVGSPSSSVGSPPPGGSGDRRGPEGSGRLQGGVLSENDASPQGATPSGGSPVTPPQGTPATPRGPAGATPRGPAGSHWPPSAC